ncbi:MAG: acylphosphatase [Euryarchaeota archaeon]|nr:acylphosphatase [Euryarchaeota archaeon]
MAKKGVRVIFFGRVQGVWFRANTQRKASGAGLCGYVRNREDGSVEALFEGEEAAVRRVLDEISSGAGMGAALVERRQVEWVEPAGEHEGFVIARED